MRILLAIALVISPLLSSCRVIESDLVEERFHFQASEKDGTDWQVNDSNSRLFVHAYLHSNSSSTSESGAVQGSVKKNEGAEEIVVSRCSMDGGARVETAAMTFMVPAGFQWRVRWDKGDGKPLHSDLHMRVILAGQLSAARE